MNIRRFITKSLQAAEAPLRNITLKNKLRLLSMLVLAGLAVSALVSVALLSKVRIGGDQYQQIKANRDLLENIAKLGSKLNHYRAQMSIIIDETNRDKAAQIRAGMDAIEGEVGAGFSGLLSAALSEEKKVPVEDARATWSEFLTTSTSEILPAVAEGKRSTARDLATGIQEQRYDRFIEQIDSLVMMTGLENEELEASAQSLAGRVLVMLVAITGAVFIVVLAVVQLIARSIIQPVAGLAEMNKRISGGDLQVDVLGERSMQTRDEIGDLAKAVAKMVDDLRGLITQIRASAQKAAQSARQIAEGTEQLSQGTAEQAASTEEASSSIEEMNATIKQNADNSMQTEKIAFKSAADAKGGGKAVALTVSAMKEIAGKISIIEEIARQTNLLALNAAIEAARAGEHGKGFAVVASEVRKLAERSQTSAKEISELSRSSIEVAEQAGEMLAKLVPDIQKTAELVQEISASSKEQAGGADQINNALQQLNRVVQQNAAAAEEMASTAAEMSTQAEDLEKMVAFFKVGDQGGGQTPAVPACKVASGARPARQLARRSAKPGKGENGTRLEMSYTGAVKRDQSDAEFERY